MVAIRIWSTIQGLESWHSSPTPLQLGLCVIWALAVRLLCESAGREPWQGASFHGWAVQGSCGSGAAVMPPLPGSSSWLWQRQQLPGGLFWETFGIFVPESPLKSLFFSPLNNSKSDLLFNESPLCLSSRFYYLQLTILTKANLPKVSLIQT